MGPVLVALDDFRGVAHLLGDLPQNGDLLVACCRDVGGLEEFVQRGRQRIVVCGQSEERGVNDLGEARDWAAAGAVVVVGCRLPADAEVHRHVTGRGAGADLVGECASDVVRRRNVGGRGRTSF